MSLDKNLFTLNFTPYPANPNVIDLIDPSGVAHYRKQRAEGSLYEIKVYDPVSDSLLVTATGANATSKTKVLQLHNPSSVVELKSIGLISFRWSFKWEQHEFEWKTEECFMIRKPDPPVLVAVASEPPSRIKTGSVQIMDYNLNRFDIDDRKGLEIVILTALFTFQDLNESYHTPPPYDGSSTSGELNIPLLRNRKSSRTPPILPPRPQPRVGVARIAEMQAFQGEVNEVTVTEEGEVNDYAQHCCNLLKDDAMLFITIRSLSAADVFKVLQVVEQTKRIRHKAEEEELHQYAVYEQEKPKGPKRINLNDPSRASMPLGSNYSPPTSLAIHLSKIDMPELRPRQAASSPPDHPGEARKDKGKKKGKDRSNDKGEGKDRVQPAVTPPTLNKLTKPSPNAFAPANTHSYDSRHSSNPPPLPVPSATQLANPTVYGAWTRPNHSRVSSGPSSSLIPGYVPPSNGQPPPFPQSEPGTRPLSMAGLLDLFTRR